MRFLRTFLQSALIVSALIGRASADGVMRDSVGAVPSGRGGTNIAHSDNGAVLLSNPAGMVNYHGRGLFEGGIDTLVTDLRYSDPRNHTGAEFQTSFLPQAAAFGKSADGRWAAGIGVFIPAGFSAEWNLTAPPPFPGPEMYRSEGSLIKILPGAAVRLTDRLSVGATLGLGISQVELQGPFFVQTPPLQGAPTRLNLKARDVAPTWSVGLQYLLNETTMLGLVYTSETRFRLKGQADADVFVVPPGMFVSSQFDAEMRLVWPQSLGVGVTHLLSEQHRVSADVIWYDWSRAFDGLDMTLSNPTNAAFAPVAPIQDRLPLNWDDVLSFRFGWEYFPTCCDTVRAGYIHNTRAVPGGTLTPYLPGILEHTLSAGYGRVWGDYHLDFAYQFAFGSERRVAASQLAGGNFDGSRMTARAHWMFLTLSRHF